MFRRVWECNIVQSGHGEEGVFGVFPEGMFVCRPPAFVPLVPFDLHFWHTSEAHQAPGMFVVFCPSKFRKLIEGVPPLWDQLFKRAAFEQVPNGGERAREEDGAGVKKIAIFCFLKHKECAGVPVFTAGVGDIGVFHIAGFHNKKSIIKSMRQGFFTVLCVGMNAFSWCYDLKQFMRWDMCGHMEFFGIEFEHALGDEPGDRRIEDEWARI
jgi:hypothetical protein